MSKLTELEKSIKFLKWEEKEFKKSIKWLADVYDKIWADIVCDSKKLKDLQWNISSEEKKLVELQKQVKIEFIKVNEAEWKMLAEIWYERDLLLKWKSILEKDKLLLKKEQEKLYDDQKDFENSLEVLQAREKEVLLKEKELENFNNQINDKKAELVSVKKKIELISEKLVELKDIRTKVLQESKSANASVLSCKKEIKVMRNKISEDIVKMKKDLTKEADELNKKAAENIQDLIDKEFDLWEKAKHINIEKSKLKQEKVLLNKQEKEIKEQIKWFLQDNKDFVKEKWEFKKKYTELQLQKEINEKEVIKAKDILLKNKSILKTIDDKEKDIKNILKDNQEVLKWIQAERLGIITSNKIQNKLISELNIKKEENKKILDNIENQRIKNLTK